MTKENLVTVRPGVDLDTAKELLHQHRIEKLLVVDDHFELKGLITVKDIEKKIQYPNACKDERGRLRVGAAVGVGSDWEERVEGLGARRRRSGRRRHGAWPFEKCARRRRPNSPALSGSRPRRRQRRHR